jgi:hypothetical protein
MSTFTPRVALEKPAPEDLMSLGDNVLSANYNKIDAAIGTHVNGVAPAATFNGKLWSPGTDTFIQDLSAWRYLGNGIYGRGFRGYDADSVLRTCPTPNPTEINLLNVSFTAVLGRNYLIDYSTFLKFTNPTGHGERYITKFKMSGSTIHTRNWEWNNGDSPLGMDLMGFFVYAETVATQNRTIEFWASYETDFSGPMEANTGGVQTTLNVQDWQAT